MLEKNSEEIIDILKDIRALIKISHYEEISKIFKEIEPWERFLYSLLDGNSSTREIADKVPVSRLSVLRRLQRWKKLGIVKQGKQGVYRKVIDLESLGIEIPEIEEDDKK